MPFLRIVDPGANLARCDKAARFVCTECGGRGWHYTGCPEDVEEEDEG